MKRSREERKAENLAVKENEIAVVAAENEAKRGMTTVPTPYSPEVAEEIFECLANGQSLREICKRPEMPARGNVYAWIRHNTNGFADHWRDAKLAGIESLADDILDIADDGTNDWMERAGKDGKVEVVADKEHIQRSKVRIDTRKWLLAKLLPKVYGDSTKVQVEDVTVRDLSDDQLLKKIASMQKVIADGTVIDG